MSAVKERGSDRVFNIINRAVLTLVLIVVVYPLIYVLSASVSSPDLVNAGKLWLLPQGIQFDGYRRVFQDAGIWTGYRNTVIYTVLGTFVSLFVTLTAAYSLSRKDFIGRNAFTALFTVTMFFGGGLIPTYLLVKGLGMRDTVWVMVILNAVTMYNIIIARTFFQTTIPVELQEASFLDGCSNIRLFLSVVLPLSKPIISVMCLFYGVVQWNGYFTALIYLNDKNLYPLQLVLRQILIINQQSIQMMETNGQLDLVEKQARLAELIKYVVIIVSSVPLLAVYPFLQKYFAKGMLMGAIKG